MKAYELLTDPENWTQGVYVKPKKGPKPESSISPKPEEGNPETDCFCLLGAIRYCYPDQNGPTRRQAINLVFDTLYERCNIAATHWNDDPNRTHEEVVALLKELDV